MKPKKVTNRDLLAKIRVANRYKPEGNQVATNRQIHAGIHKLAVPTLVKLYDEIRNKVSKLPAIQRAIVIGQVKEYIKLGIVTVTEEPVETKTE